MSERPSPPPEAVNSDLQTRREQYLHEAIREEALRPLSTQERNEYGHEVPSTSQERIAESVQARLDLDEYLSSRPYKDGRGNIRRPDGPFTNSDSYFQSLRDKHYDESLDQGKSAESLDYEDMPMQQLAKVWGTAEAEGNQAKAEFIDQLLQDKMIKAAEKHGLSNNMTDIMIDRMLKLKDAAKNQYKKATPNSVPAAEPKTELLSSDSDLTLPLPPEPDPSALEAGDPDDRDLTFPEPPAQPSSAEAAEPVTAPPAPESENQSPESGQSNEGPANGMEQYFKNAGFSYQDTLRVAQQLVSIKSPESTDYDNPEIKRLALKLNAMMRGLKRVNNWTDKQSDEFFEGVMSAARSKLENVVIDPTPEDGSTSSEDESGKSDGTDNAENEPEPEGPAIDWGKVSFSEADLKAAARELMEIHKPFDANYQRAYKKSNKFKKELQALAKDREERLKAAEDKLDAMLDEIQSVMGWKEDQFNNQRSEYYVRLTSDAWSDITNGERDSEAEDSETEEKPLSELSNIEQARTLLRSGSGRASLRELARLDEEEQERPRKRRRWLARGAATGLLTLLLTPGLDNQGNYNDFSELFHAGVDSSQENSQT